MSTVGTTLSVAGTNVAEVFNVSGPSFSQTAVDTTHHTSTSRFRTFVPGFSDGGEVSFDIRYIPTDATHDETANTGLVGLFGATSTTTFVLTFPDNGATSNSNFSFDGIVTDLTPTADLDTSLDASVTIKVSGKPTFTAAA